MNILSHSRPAVFFIPHKNLFQQSIEALLEQVDIKVGGTRPWDLCVHDRRFFRRVFLEGSMGLGEAYMDGWWDCEQLDEFFTRLLQAPAIEKRKSFHKFATHVMAMLTNQQTKSRSIMGIRKHYDIGNDLYHAMLDPRMIYSCGYWKEAKTLEEAQTAKLDLICKKLHLEPGMKVLDIGCGWGGFARYAAEHYGVRVLGVTISYEQYFYARQCSKNPDVDIRFEDYRDLDQTFDRIVSVGMFEHVGYKNYQTYMSTVRSCLHHDGLFLLQTIGGNQPSICTDPWFQKYIFPGSMLPSLRQIGQAIEGQFVMEDWHNFGPNYDSTLMSWHKNFCRNWNGLKSKYDERFFRMWNYYLLASAAAFRTRKN
ncbi:MAG: cyclopropane fatty acyl phospholipid synthase, partial [Deltaproteobacteria bacterium]|nr:cyclopropane fatty acyl phospholipid synthase [Deltaproteobacteria bacterium]